jgi:CBS-domain-containing membrane protein
MAGLLRRLAPLAQAWIATALALILAAWLLRLTDYPWILAPLGGSCVILFGMRDGDMAQPRSLFGGHLIAALCGLVALRWGWANLGGAKEWWSVGAVATALALMMATRTIHSPAGATPIIIFLEDAKWNFVLTPVLAGCAVLFAVALLANNTGAWRDAKRYPLRWT